MNYERLIRQIRNSPLLFDSDDDHKIHRILGKAQAIRAKRRVDPPQARGPYSGMTKRELAMSGTCEPDWF